MNIPINATIGGFSKEEGGHRYVGRVDMLGASFHVDCIRVKGEPDYDAGELFGPFDDAPETVHQVFESMQGFYDGVYETVELPGVEGKFVMFIHPFCQ